MTQDKAGAAPRPLSPARRRALRKLKRTRSWRRFLLRLTGWFCIFLGILGLILPILQGILFLLIGIYILARVSPRIRLFRRKLRAKARTRYPKWTGKFEEAEARAGRMVDRILKPNKKRP